jgi:hypothetical protein
VADELQPKYDLLFDLIRREFPYGAPVEMTIPTSATVVKAGWLADHDLENPKFIREEEAQEEGDSTSYHWQFAGDTDEHGQPLETPLRVTKAMKIVYKYQRPVPRIDPKTKKPKLDADGKWVLKTDAFGVPELETVEASLLIGYRGPEH